MSKFKVYEYMVGMQGTFVNMANGHRAQPGQYVAYGDYLILLAELNNSNRINTELLVLSNRQASEVRRLKAKVKRLRIAGDEMANAIHPFDWDDEVRRWNEAKEGKPSV